MRPIVNMSEEDWATDTGSMHKDLVKIARRNHTGSLPNFLCILPAVEPFWIWIVHRAENPFPAICNAAYRKYVEGGPSHGHRQHAQKIWFGKDREHGSRDILAARQTDRQTDRPTDRDSPHNTLKLGEVKKLLCSMSLIHSSVDSVTEWKVKVSENDKERYTSQSHPFSAWTVVSRSCIHSLHPPVPDWLTELRFYIPLNTKGLFDYRIWIHNESEPEVNPTHIRHA